MTADPQRELRALVDANAYMTLATADADGRPWASPVWFAHRGYREFLWVSRPDTRHSRNVAERTDVGLVIFDSTVPIGTGVAVYAEARAEPAVDADAIEVFSGRSVGQGGSAWTLADVSDDARLRLYRATASALFLLDEHDRRVQVTL
jgi:pyridoxine/pyridoxamine 5'-phosphate oxidase